MSKINDAGLHDKTLRLIILIESCPGRVCILHCAGCVVVRPVYIRLYDKKMDFEPLSESEIYVAPLKLDYATSAGHLISAQFIEEEKGMLTSISRTNTWGPHCSLGND